VEKIDQTIVGRLHTLRWSDPPILRPFPNVHCSLLRVSKKIVPSAKPAVVSTMKKEDMNHLNTHAFGKISSDKSINVSQTQLLRLSNSGGDVV